MMFANAKRGIDVQTNLMTTLMKILFHAQIGL